MAVGSTLARRPSPAFVRRARAALLAAVLTLGIASPALAGPETSASADAKPSAPLPPLPKLPPIAKPETDPAAAKDVARVLELLTSEDPKARENAKAALADGTPAMIGALRNRVAEIKGSLDRDAAGRLLEDARKAGRAARKKADQGAAETAKKKKKGAADEDDGDWLDFLLASAKPKDRTWRDLTELVGIVRLLTAAGTTPAVRELVQLHASFGDLLRIDLQRQVAKLKDKAVPALIEARQHDAKIVQRWANRQLDLLGRAIPGEAVSTSDPGVLVDVLRAYGRTRDVDALRVLLSFCNSDRVQLRDAAREALGAIGEPGLWQLRDAWLNQTGQKPPRDWTWDRIARELFALHDRARLTEVYKLMDEGVAAFGEKKSETAVAIFDKVLARAPLFDRRAEMVPAYRARAAELEEAGQREAALELLRKALRLDPEGPDAKRLTADVAALEGVVLVDRGTPDRFILERALELDAGNERARRALASLEQRAEEKRTDATRYVAAGGVLLIAVAAMILLWRRPVVAPLPPR